jgi:hypothetical protein
MSQTIYYGAEAAELAASDQFYQPYRDKSFRGT